MFEAVAYLAGNNIDPDELRLHAHLDKQEHINKHPDIKSYYDHLRTYNNPELLLIGGA